MTKETIFTNQMEIRNKVSDLVADIDTAEMEDSQKIVAIEYAIKMLNDLKAEISA